MMGHPFFRIVRILRMQPQNPQHPKKRLPVGVVLFKDPVNGLLFLTFFGIVSSINMSYSQ